MSEIEKTLLDVCENVGAASWLNKLAVREPLALMALLGVDDNDIRRVFRKNETHIVFNNTRFVVLSGKQGVTFQMDYAFGLDKFKYDARASGVIIGFFEQVLYCIMQGKPYLEV